METDDSARNKFRTILAVVLAIATADYLQNYLLYFWANTACFAFASSGRAELEPSQVLTSTA